MFTKACPKCSGDVYQESLLDGTVDFVCLQCGCILNPPQSARVLAAARPRTSVFGLQRVRRAA